jgi:hypothetical protein
MNSANMIFHGKKDCQKEYGLIARETQTATCNLGEGMNDAVITSLGVIVKDASSDTKGSNQFSRKHFEGMGGVGGDASLVSKLDRWDEIVSLGIMDHLSAPEVSKQHVEINFQQLDDSEPLDVKVAFFLPEHYLKRLGPAHWAEPNSNGDSTHSVEDLNGGFVVIVVVDQCLVEANVATGR